MTPRLHNCNSTRRMGAAEGWGEASRRAVRNLALLAALAVAIGARTETETVGGYT